MARKSAKEIQAIQDRPTKTIPVPEWDTDVEIRILSTKERTTFQQRHAKAMEKGLNPLFAAQLVVLACVGEDGKPLFTEADMAWLLEKSGLAVERIADEVWTINKLGKQEQEGAEKNSVPTPTADSSSSSPASTASSQTS